MWLQGQRPDLDNFLASAGTLAPLEMAALLRVDQAYRWWNGECIAVEAYLQKYPQVQADLESLLDLVYGEFILRERNGEHPDVREYRDRFPQHAGALQLQIKLHEAIQACAVVPNSLGSPGDATPPLAACADSVEQPAVPNYEILAPLGRGGMAVVYKARQISLNRIVALKVITAGAHAAPAERARFRTEAEVAARLCHANVVRIYEVGAVSGLPYLALEFMDRGSLAPCLAGKPLSPRHAAELVELLARTVQAAHDQNIIHRDLKPGNVLLASPPAPQNGAGAAISGSGVIDLLGVPKITDFGLAKCLHKDGGQTTTGTILGSPDYMAPEQAAGKTRDIGPAADIYALGAILYEALTGRPPFRGMTLFETLAMVRSQEPVSPSRLQPALSRDLVTICLKALAKEPGRRYASANALADDLRRFRADLPVRARPVTKWERLWRWCRRNPTLAGLVTALALTFFAGFAGVIWKWRDAERAQQDERLARTAAEGHAEKVRQGFEQLKAANSLLDRGRWYLHELRWDAAHAAFSKAIDLRADHANAWFERGELYVRLGLWDLAAADFDRELELREPDVPRRKFLDALLRQYVGDADGCRRISRRMREQFHGIRVPAFAIDLVRASVLAPDRDADLTLLLELAENALTCEPGVPHYLYVLGMAHYRAGHYEQAVRRLRESLAKGTGWSGAGLNYPVLAMAHYRLGQGALARQALHQAALAIDQWTRDRYQSQKGYWAHHLGAVGFWPIPWWDWLECQLFYREAKELIDGAAPLEDPRLRVLRARALAGLRWQGKADSEYTQAQALLPRDQQVRLEAHRNRGYLRVQERRWNEAASEFACALELQPAEAKLGCYQAMAYLGGGDLGGYRSACTALVKNFGKTKDAATAHDVVYFCVLRGDALSNMQCLVPLARVAAPAGQGNAYVLGAALYRAGRYDEAIRCLEAAQKVYRPRAWDWCFLAMAHHRLDHAGEACRCLTEAARWIDEANRADLDDLAGTQPSWGGWYEPLVYPLLLREGEELIGRFAE
jgi:serine/threonine protein kinase/tetratricopeptide (TPR) repeat protein